MYKAFTIYDSVGNILVSGEVPTEAVQLQLNGYPNAFLIEEASDPATDIVDTINKVVLKGQKPIPPPPVKTYAENRIEMYPQLQEQLDMLWHSMDRGETPKSEPFYTYIKTIKQSYPKDNSAASGSVSIVSAESIP